MKQLLKRCLFDLGIIRQQYGSKLPPPRVSAMWKYNQYGNVDDNYGYGDRSCSTGCWRDGLPPRRLYRIVRGLSRPHDPPTSFVATSPTRHPPRTESPPLCLQSFHVRRARAAITLLNVELELLTLLGLCPWDIRDVKEHVVVCVIGIDEPVAIIIVEEAHRATCHARH